MRPVSCGHVIHVCCGKRKDAGCFGELGGLQASMSTLALPPPDSLVTGTALADQMSYLSKTMRLRVSMVQEVAGDWEQDGSQVEVEMSSRVRVGGGKMMLSGRPGI